VNENQVSPIDEKALEAHNIKNELATSMIFRVLSNEILFMIFSSNSIKEALKNMLYVPKLNMNLLFLIQVTRKGYSFKFNSHSWCIKKGLATLWIKCQQRCALL